MKSVHTILSALLAGMMVVSLAACTTPGTGANGSDPSATQTDAVPQGRWVEQQATGISSTLVITSPPVALDNGSLVLYARDESADMPPTVRLTSTDNGASWQPETLDWTEKAGILARSTARQDGTVAFTTTESTLWLATPDGSLTQMDLSVDGNNVSLSQMCFLSDGTLAAVPAGGPGISLPGNILFYDIDAQKVKSWVQVGSGNQSWAEAGTNGDGENVYFGDNDIAGILPAGDESGSFLYYFSSNGDLCRADQDGTTQTVQTGFLSDPYSAQAAMGTDGSICYADRTGIYRQAQGGSLREKVVDGTGTALSLSSNYISQLCCAPDGSYLAIVSDGSMQTKLYRYSFDPTLSAPVNTLEVWSLEENATVRAAIQPFTQQNPDCAVEYEVALQEGAGLTKDDALRTLNTELLAGEGPDLLILDGADLESFSGSGLLLDLSGMVDTGSLYDFVTDRYTDADGELFTLPARFTVPVMHGAAGTLDGVSTLDDVAALVQQYAPRPAETSWAPLDESQQYALGFDSVDSLVQFALQTSQPALLTADSLDEAKLRDLMEFLQTVGEDYNMAAYPEPDTMNGTAGNFGGVDTVVWNEGMSEYAQTSRAVFGYGSMTTPAWLGATDTELRATGQTILQPGLCQGVYLPSCFVAVSATSDQPDYAAAFVKALFSDEVQGSFQYDGMPVSKAGMQAFLDRNMSEMQENGYTGGFEELLAQLSTPVVVDEALQDSLIAHTKALLSGNEAMDQAVAGVVSDLSLRFAEQG